MNRRARRGSRQGGIRIRLGLALAIALAPVLILSGLQSALIFHRDASDKKAELIGGASRAARATRDRILQSEGFLKGLASAASGYQCVGRLADLRARLPGFVNLIRFDPSGWVTCAASPVPVDGSRRSRPWFQTMISGRPLSVAADAEGAYAVDPAILVSARLNDANGRFAGAMTAIINAASLRPGVADRSMPIDSEVALSDAEGRFLSSATPGLFPANSGRRLSEAKGNRGILWLGSDRRGDARLFASAYLMDGLFVVLSAPSEGLVSWARLNPLSAFVLPMLAFLLALAAVALVAERGVVSWIFYLRRIAQIYARGRYSVRPIKAVAAPAEIRELAEAMGGMAATLAARDIAIKENLAAKDNLMREIHHRVKNNLQVISSLLSLQQRSLEDEAARAAIRDTRQRILALSVIYRALYEGPDLKHVDLKDFVNELVAQLMVENRDLPTRTDLRAAPLIIDPDRLAPLALFIVEAVANVGRKNSRRADDQLQIRFTPRESEGELFILDGAPPAGASDLGLTLMKVFARQLGGEISYPKNTGGGQDARLVFPLRAA